MAGWIKLSRDINKHWIWQSDRRLKWWIDILITVNHADSKVLIKGSLIECKRGQSVMSLETWARRWNVTKKTVKDFFELLQKDSMLLYESVKISTRITVCNYDSYQGDVNATETESKRKVNGKETVTTPKQEGIRRRKKVVGDFTDQSFNFYLTEATKAKGYPGNPMAMAYIEMGRHICQKRDGVWDMPYVLKIEKQISLDQFSKLYEKADKDLESITTKIDSIQNKIDYWDRYTDLYKTINAWFNNDHK